MKAYFYGPLFLMSIGQAPENLQLLHDVAHAFFHFQTTLCATKDVKSKRVFRSGDPFHILLPCFSIENGRKKARLRRAFRTTLHSN
jgi:hypothetical protein